MTRVTAVFAILSCAMAAFHAFMVFLINTPSNAIRQSFAPVVTFYDGPWLHQSWSIFAPNPPEANVHVLVRGRNRNGRVTAWYDASLFFLDIVGRNRLNPLRELGEGLGHAALAASQDDRNILARAFVTRTAAMVLRLYAPSASAAEQIELDCWQIPAPGTSRKAVSVDRWHWQPIPNVAPLHF